MVHGHLRLYGWDEEKDGMVWLSSRTGGRCQGKKQSSP